MGISLLLSFTPRQLFSCGQVFGADGGCVVVWGGGGGGGRKVHSFSDLLIDCILLFVHKSFERVWISARQNDRVPVFAAFLAFELVSTLASRPFRTSGQANGKRIVFDYAL